MQVQFYMCLIKQHVMKAFRRVEVYVNAFLTSALDARLRCRYKCDITTECREIISDDLN